MNIKQRLYEDFFRPSKEGEYEAILKAARENGYVFHSVLSFEDIISHGAETGKKYLVSRHDIDTADFSILRKMLALEKKYGARASYYFRWNTLNIQLMKDISESGGEASYHFEEVATYCYKKCIRSRETIREQLETIRKIFITNLTNFRMKTGQPCLTLASHGDYINEKIGFSNRHLVDESVRNNYGVIREAYDSEHIDMLTCRIADQEEGDLFSNKAIAAIKRGEPILELLTHPRQWNSPCFINLKEEINSMCKRIYMRL